MKTIYSLFLTLLIALPSIAQNTMGTIYHDPDQAFEGYNLLFPYGQPYIYLLDNCGQVVKQWGDELAEPGSIAYLEEDGKLYVMADTLGAMGSRTNVLEIWSWDNELIWRYINEDSTKVFHHDIEVLPNGNILVLAVERKSLAEAMDAGRDDAKLTDAWLETEVLMELEPVGSSDANIVWEWYAWDHLVQDFNDQAANYGSVYDSPRRIDLNYDEYDGQADWLHINSVDYNPALDQIMLSVPHFNELWVIDHSTTSEEAATSSGGLSGVGGDLMARWGNPKTYRRSEALHPQKLFFQHDTHWLDLELDSSDPSYGKIGLFNNRVGIDTSTVDILDLPFDTANWAYPFDSLWGPADFEWSFTIEPSSVMYSDILSSMQQLANGNTIALAGRQGYAVEVNPMGEVVWAYQLPIAWGEPLSQGNPVPNNGTYLFRIQRYSKDYPAFVGKDLSPMGYLELNPDTAACQLPTTVSIEATEWQDDIVIAPNPVHSDLYVQLGEVSPMKPHKIEILNALGQVQYQADFSEQKHYIDTQYWEAGIYLLRVNDSKGWKIMKQ